MTIKPGDIGDGRTTANYIGRSVYSGDKYLKGKVRDFSIYNRALSADEVREMAADRTAILGVGLPSLKVPAIIDAASSTVTLPVEPGTDLTTLDPAYDVVSSSSVEIAGLASECANAGSVFSGRVARPPRWAWMSNGDAYARGSL